MATLGTFDGFHRGHALLFEKLEECAGKYNLPPVVITFHPHPRMVVTPANPPLLLTTTEEKVEILSQWFRGSLIILNFNSAFRKMTADDFANNILISKIGIKALVVGFNHSFGHDRSGNIEHLKEIGQKDGFDVEVVGPVSYKEMPISSSRIRRALTAGEWTDAINMLGHPYSIRGRVVRGLGRGRSLGWPTLNLEWSPRKLLPPSGVYSCLVDIDSSQYKGMMFIGINMLNPQKKLSVEAHVFDFEGNLYDREVTLYPMHFIRENARFESTSLLSQQIAKDKQTVLGLLK